jgi:hypothetical protein
MIQLSASATIAVQRRRAIKAVLCAWLLAGTLDIAAASIYYPLASGVKVMTLLQGIASGVVGEKAFVGGLATAALGVALHYLIALIWTLVLFGVFRKVYELVANRFVIGMAYGIVVWIVMNLIVLPQSRVHQAPFNLSKAIVGAVILMFCIGLPIAMIVGKYDLASRDPTGVRCS